MSDDIAMVLSVSSAVPPPPGPRARLLARTWDGARGCGHGAVREADLCLDREAAVGARLGEDDALYVDQLALAVDRFVVGDVRGAERERDMFLPAERGTGKRELTAERYFEGDTDSVRLGPLNL